MRLLLSCISTKHSVLKQHWDETSQETQCPLTVLGSYQKPKQDLGGLLCFIEDLGCSQKTVEIKMAAGMVDTDRGVFVTSFGSIHKVDTDSGAVHQNAISSPLFNDRETGEWQSVLEGLDHPHSVRILDEEHFTVADTVRGRALLVKLNKDKGETEAEIDAGTSWLQDCRFDAQHNSWILVDGKKSRVILRRGLKGDKTLAQFDFDPEWRLYETHVL